LLRGLKKKIASALGGSLEDPRESSEGDIASEKSNKDQSMRVIEKAIVEQVHDWAPKWNQLIDAEQEFWHKTRELAKVGKTVLIANAAGGHPVLDVFESLLAMALAVRGANVKVLSCDGIPACLQATADQFKDPEEFKNHGPSRTICASCTELGETIFGSTSLPVIKINDYLTNADFEKAKELVSAVPFDELQSYLFSGINLGEQARAGALRYFASGELNPDDITDAVLRRYLEAAIQTTIATERMLEAEKIDCVFMSHAIYIPHGAIAEVTRKNNKELVVWQLAYKDRSVIVSHHDIYFRTMLNEPTEMWEHLKWTEEMENDVMSYVLNRGQGIKDWFFSFQQNAIKDVSKIEEELKIDFSKPTIGLLTNVIWDAQLFYSDCAFESMTEWLIKTIEYFVDRPDLQLVIRIHPGEVRVTMPSKQKALDEINLRFPNLPPNIFIVPPESMINSYVLMDQCWAALIYGTTMGMELAAMGIPVVVTGQSWIRNKGIAFDMSSQEAYFELLKTMPFASKRLDKAKTKRARMYVYHYNFRRTIPLKNVIRREGWPPMAASVDSLRELEPGNDLGLDIICNGIQSGADFIYPAESLSTSEKKSNAF
jgi:hypothetical protein